VKPHALPETVLASAAAALSEVDILLSELAASGAPVAIAGKTGPIVFDESRTDAGEARRFLCHFAGAGGSMVARALAQRPNVQVLGATRDPSQPLAVEPSFRRTPPGLVEALRAALAAHGSPSGPQLVREALDRLQRASEDAGRHLVLCAGIHDGFLADVANESQGQTARDAGGPNAVRSILLVRHPVDGFASALRRRAVASRYEDIDAYAERCLAFLDAHHGPIVRHEDLIESPRETMAAIAAILGLPEVSDLGLPDPPADVRPARALRSDTSEVVSTSRSVRLLCERLGYGHEIPAARTVASGGAADRASAPPAPTPVDAALVAQLSKKQDDVAAAVKRVEQIVKREIANVARQVEAYLSVQSALSGGILVPPMHGWPISPDLARLLVELIKANDYDLVLEFGSGTSTVVIARMLAVEEGRRTSRPPVRQVAFEHLEPYRATTQRHLEVAGLGGRVSLHHAPLEPYVSVDGTSYPFYGCRETLAAIGASFGSEVARVLVLVDGPPGSTGEHARYPALPLVMEALGGASVDVLLDDYVRDDERAVVEMWQQDLRAMRRRFELTVHPLEKQACLVRVHGGQVE
jgi:hypothetical protein